jgi:glycosyltransferase involved in cell wall biosynthesis
MHLGVAGPVTLEPFRHRFGQTALPETLSFPLIGHLVEELVQRGHRVTVFAGSIGLPSPVEMRGDGVDLVVVPLRARRAPYNFYRPERAALAEAIRRSTCDLIHAHWTYEFAAGALDSGRPTLVTAHDSPPAILRYFILTRYAPFWTARVALGVRVLRRARRLTTVSPYCRDSIRRWIRPQAPISVVPNGIGPACLELGRERLARGPREGSATMAAVMEGFQERKNPKRLMEAFAMVRCSHPSAELHLFGTGYEPDGPAEAWGRTRGLCSGVEFRGKVPHAELVAALSSRVDLLVHPAKEESFGMAPLEAMALGLPVIGGANSGGVDYVLGGGTAGLLVNVSSPRDIAAAACALLGDPARRHSLAQAGWQRASREFTIDRMVTLYEAEYAKIMDENPAPPR